MSANRRPALAALTAAGLLWGSTVPLSKLALEWLPPGWLTFVRFGLAAAVLLMIAGSRVRAALTPAILASGAIGYGGSVLVQNVGITRTSVSQAALLMGAAPVLVAIIAALWQHSVARPLAWAGFAVSLAGVALVAGGGGGGASLGGDGLVLASLLLSAAFTVAQTRLLRGRDPVAVTAVQFLAAALVALPVAIVTERFPAVPAGSGALLAVIGLAVGGTLVPFTLFAYGQTRVSAEVAGAFLNLEPLVGALAGVVFFADPAGLRQAGGGAAILAGIALGSLRWRAARRSAADLGNRDCPQGDGSDVVVRGVAAGVAGQGQRAAVRKPVDLGPADLAEVVLLQGYLMKRADLPRVTGLAVGRARGAGLQQVGCEVDRVDALGELQLLDRRRAARDDRVRPADDVVDDRAGLRRVGLRRSDLRGRGLNCRPPGVIGRGHRDAGRRDQADADRGRQAAGHHVAHVFLPLTG